MNDKKSLLSSLAAWFDERWPFSPIIKWSLEKQIVGGTSFAYVLGGITLFLFVILAATGVLQAFYYVPTVDNAYESLMFLRLKVPFGWLIHGMHYWAANAFVVVIGLHMLRVFIWGAYKKPRELTWISGVLLMILTCGFIYTGPFLAWDKQGYWAGKVGMGIVETVPFIGESLVNLLQGGSTMGQLTISRFFTWHVFILPALMFLLIIFHLIAFRQFGSVGPWNPEKRKISGPFWPDQIFKDIVALVAVLLVLIGIIAYVGVPITGLADPLDTTVYPKPAWPFLIFYEALKAFKGPWEVIGTVGLPVVFILLLVLPPFVDRNSEQNPLRRLGIVIPFVTFLVLVFIFTLKGYYSNPEDEIVAGAAPPAVSLSVPGKSEETANKTMSPGETLFTAQSCSSCHILEGDSAGIGPNLRKAGLDKMAVDELKAHITNPQKFNPNTVMPAYTTLTADQVDALVTFLKDLKPAQSESKPKQVDQHEAAAEELKRNQLGPAARMVGSAQHGEVIYLQFCASCHNVGGAGGIANPGSTTGTIPALKGINPKLFDNDPDLFAEKIDPYLQYGSRAAEAQSLRPMPNFGEAHAMTQEQIADVEAYILALNGIDRGKIIDPGVEPTAFFKIVLAIFALTGLCILALKVILRPNK